MEGLRHLFQKYILFFSKNEASKQRNQKRCLQFISLSGKARRGMPEQEIQLLPKVNMLHVNQGLV
jgi:hypothetical protein